MPRRHRRPLLALGSIGLALLGACNDAPTSFDPESAPAFQQAPGGTTGEYIILASGDALPADIDANVTAAGGTIVRTYEELGVAVALANELDFATRAAAIPGVESVTEDRLLQLTDPDRQTVELSDLLTGPMEQVASIADGEFLYPLQWAPAAVNAPEAWNAGYTGRGVRVAILDGGLFNLHPDLAPNIDVVASRSFVPGFAYNSDVGTFWHGTHVAGIVAAADNADGTGVIGIAPNATLIGVKVLHNGNGAIGPLIQGVMYAARPRGPDGAGAHIINMSLGVLLVDVKDEEARKGVKELTKSLDRAMRYAHQRGVTVIAAAGNDAVNLDAVKDAIAVPAQSAYVISIGGTGPLGWAKGNTNFARLGSYSNWGKSVIDLSAPGGDDAYTPVAEMCTVFIVRTNCLVFDMYLSTTRTGWGWASGTSMASPVAAGIAALVIERAGGTLSPAEVEAALRGGALDLGKPGNDAVYGKGWVNALGSISWMGTNADAAPSVTSAQGSERR